MTTETFVLPSGDVAIVVPDPPVYLTHAEEIKALRKFAKALERMSPNARKAAILWMADFYGISGRLQK